MSITLVCFSSIIHCSDTDCAMRVQNKSAVEEEKREEFATHSAVQVKNIKIKFLVFICNSVLSIDQIITASRSINQDAYACYIA